MLFQLCIIIIESTILRQRIEINEDFDPTTELISHNVTVIPKQFPSLASLRSVYEIPGYLDQNYMISPASRPGALYFYEAYNVINREFIYSPILLVQNIMFYLNLIWVIIVLSYDSINGWIELLWGMKCREKFSVIIYISYLSFRIR